MNGNPPASLSPEKRRYPQHEGWFRPARRGFRQACCDCGLIHVIDFRIRRGTILEMRVERDNRATMARRRAKPIVARKTVAAQLRAMKRAKR